MNSTHPISPLIESRYFRQQQPIELQKLARRAKLRSLVSTASRCGRLETNAVMQNLFFKKSVSFVFMCVNLLLLVQIN
jgi:hypothetical protein